MPAFVLKPSRCSTAPVRRPLGSLYNAGKTIVISADTVPSGKIVEPCNGCDVLIHEVYSAAGLEQYPYGGADFAWCSILQRNSWRRLPVERSQKMPEYGSYYYSLSAG